MSGYGNCNIRTTDDRPRRTQPPARPEHVGLVSASARRVVHLLLGHALVDEARLALRLVLRVVPSARPPQARADPLGAGARAERAAAVGLGTEARYGYKSRQKPPAFLA